MFEDSQEFISVVWKEVLSLVNEAAVFIDHGAAECLHWYSGDKAYLTLKKAGAISVHDLAVYNFLNLIAKKAKKAVIISTSIESLFYERTLKVVIEKNDFEKCLVICAAHKNVLDYKKNLLDNSNFNQLSSYDNLRKDILDWMSNKNFSKNSHVSIMYKPIFMTCIKEDIFVTPSLKNIMPFNDKILMDEYETDIKFLVSSFHTLFSHYSVQEDIYSLGQFSTYIAKKLDNLPAAISRRKKISNLRKVSLILVDRLLDLSTASSHNSESLLGRILSTLPHLSHHCNDVAVLMDSFSLKGEKCLSSLMVPGCIANSNEELKNILFNTKQKEVLLSLNKMLIDITTPTSKIPKVLTRITASSLDKCIQKLRDSENIESLHKNSKNLQLIAAAVQALKSTKTAQIDFVISLEKLILQNLAVSKDSSSVISQFSNIVKSRSSRGLDMDILLVLLIYLYAVAGPDIKFSKPQEAELKKAISIALAEDIKKCNDSELTNKSSAYFQTLLLLGLTHDNEIKDISYRITDQIFAIFHEILNQREALQNYRQLMKNLDQLEAVKHVGLLESLMSDLLNENKPYIPDLIKINSTSFKSNLNQTHKTTSHPCDNPWIIVYVLGGITPEEVRIVENIISLKGKHGPKITFGGSQLLSPLDIVDKVLLANIHL